MHLHVGGCCQVFGSYSHTFPEPSKDTRNLLPSTPSDHGNLALTGEVTAALQRLQAQEDRYCPGTVESKVLFSTSPATPAAANLAPADHTLTRNTAQI